jgi:SAM-dependent methyltransferase
VLYEVRAIAQNLVMSVGPLRKAVHARLGSTGMNGDASAASVRLDSYLKHVDVVGKAVLELGPGHTREVLTAARVRGASRCVGLDTELIVDACDGIELVTYDGSTMPFDDGAFDVIWSSDVFEHVREPKRVLHEAFRVLRPGGSFLAAIDFRDHYFLDNEERWLECLQYPEWLWWAMTSNRSSFVNRLRASDWRELFKATGFVVGQFDLRTSEVLRKMHRAGAIRSAGRQLSEEDASTYRLEVAVVKPRTSAP